MTLDPIQPRGEAVGTAKVQAHHARVRAARAACCAIRGWCLPREVIFHRGLGLRLRAADSNSLEVYVGYLRRKTEAGGEPRLIHTVRGVGWSLREK